MVCNIKNSGVQIIKFDKLQTVLMLYLVEELLCLIAIVKFYNLAYNLGVFCDSKRDHKKRRIRKVIET